MKISKKELEGLLESSDVLYKKLLHCIIDDGSNPDVRTLAVVRTLASVIVARYNYGHIKDDVSFDEYFDAAVNMMRNFAKARLEDGTGN